MRTVEKVLSVAQLTRILKGLIEDGLPSVWVEGEISNLTLHRSGHRYFSLKDVAAQISCVMWRTRATPGIELKAGMKIRAFGRVTLWEKGGRYQFDVKSIQLSGMGELQAALEELKQRLSAEGLFDLERKKTLPRFPGAVGIATSQTGAAVRDLLWGFSSRFPPVELYLIPVAVQGEGAAAEIARAIETYNRSNLVDVIIIGRGGGSLEDLWAFNEEIVIRAISNSNLPVVSAVGHEVDVTLSDLAADLRAPTPTAAAALVVPDRVELLQILREKSFQLSRTLTNSISLWRERLKRLSNSYGMKRVVSRVPDERFRLDELLQKAELALSGRVSDCRKRVEAGENQLNALSPVNVLERGYCVARKSDGIVVREAERLTIGEDLDLIFRRGSALASIKEVKTGVVS